MGDASQLPHNISALKPNEMEKSPEDAEIKQTRYKWWLQMAIYSFFVLAGQSVGTLLGRVYFDNGGNSKWLATLVQVTGFPILVPFLWFTTTKQGVNEPNTNTNTNTTKKFPTSLALFYITFGVFVAATSMLYTIGLQNLPVTTYTLICASQLGFNAFFSFFLNNQKFTPYIVNSVVLLTISSILLVFQTDSGDEHKSSKRDYVIGFLCTLAASAGYALVLSLTQLAFRKVIKNETIRAVLNLTIYQNMVATFVILIGLFASKEWKGLNREMEGFKLGKLSYIMNLFWTAVSWQAFSIGCIGLIFKISSLFSNVISILGLPLAPVLAVVFLHDKLTGLKAVSMILAIWGFVSYTYQHYIEDLEMKKRKASEELVSEVTLAERG